jgi:hypothetical protein
MEGRRMAVFKLAGVTFRQELLRRIYDDLWTVVGRADEIELDLLPEPSNPYDPSAVKVVVNAPASHAGQVGYVPAELCEKVLAALRQNRVGRIRFADMGAGRGGNVYAKIGLAARRETTP